MVAIIIMPYDYSNPELNRIVEIRKTARELNLKYYYTGIPCIRGHDCERYTLSGTCVECCSMKERREYIRFQNRKISK